MKESKWGKEVLQKEVLSCLFHRDIKFWFKDKQSIFKLVSQPGAFIS